MQNNSIFSLKKRLLAIFLLVSFVFLVIIFRLGYLQFIKGGWLQEKAVDQWTRSLPLSPIRGNINDKNGVALATNYSTYDIYVRPSMVEDPLVVANALSSTLNIDFDVVYKKVTDRFVSESLIKLQVEKDIALSFKKAEFKGVLLSENSSRYYPYGNLLTQVLGFTTIDNIGQAGLEAYYDRYLTGVKGYILEESDVKGVKVEDTMTNYVPSIPGLSLNLTIDINIQKFLDDALNTLIEEQKPKKASGIIMNPQTGEIVAMSTKPDFDLNDIPRDDVGKLLETVKNINIVDVYEPGSTFKCVTMANSIDEGVAHLSDMFFDPGYRMVDGEKIKCWKLTGHGMQTLSEGLCNSCNSVFVDLALRLGKDKMYEMFKKFGLGAPLGVDFLGESGGIIMNYDTAKTVDVARMGFGQAVAVTPLQLISSICSLVNGGKLMKPYFVESVVDSAGEVVSQSIPTEINKTISENTSNIIQNMMLDVIKQYSGYNAFIPGYDVGGKTGTSQKYADGRLSGEYIASFVGTFPAINPDYVVLIVVDEPGGASYYGSIAATPYAKMVIEKIIEYKKYSPTKPEELINNPLDEKVTMPNVIGLNVYDAENILNECGLQFEIQGSSEMVVNQFPMADVSISKNSVVMIECN
ncbi:MAG: PASTA domain-containing protein [Clostridiales bacterium]|nr:PASTA domain-containing protein [Clostridiales bacterium]